MEAAHELFDNDPDLEGLTDELSEAFEAWEGDDDTPTPTFEDPAQADRYGWALRRVRERLAEIREIADTRRAQIAAWEERETAKLARTEEFLENTLIGYHAALLAQDPKRKTVSLPAVTLKATAQQPAFDRDDDTLLKWAKTHDPELVEVTEKPKWADLKKRAAVHAIVVDGDGEAHEALIVGSKITNPETGKPFPFETKVTDVWVVDPESGEKVDGVTVELRDDAFKVEVTDG